MDLCRLLVVDQGKVDLILDGQRTTAATFSGLRDVNHIVWADHAIWLAGSTDDGRPTLRRLKSGVADMMSLPADVTAIDGLVAEDQGILAAVGTTGDHGALLRVTAQATTRIAALAAEPTRIAGKGSTVVVSTSAATGVDVLVGAPTSLRVTHLGPAVDVRAVAVDDSVVVGLNTLSHGVPTAATIMTSTDTGRTWSRHQLQGAELADLATSGGTTFVAMTWPGHEGQVFRTADTTHWTAVPPLSPAEEALPSLSPTTDGIWVIGRRAFPIAS